jgi:hypothetical protein
MTIVAKMFNYKLINWLVDIIRYPSLSSEEKYNRNLLYTLDDLLESESFTSANSRSTRDRNYQRDNYTVDVSLVVHKSFAEDNGRTVGSSMSFELKGVIPDSMSESGYSSDIRNAVRKIDEITSALGCRVDWRNYVAHQFKGRQRVRTSSLRLLYDENKTSPTKVAVAMFSAQEVMYQTMLKYVPSHAHTTELSTSQAN